jgi:hypothetical protein
MAGQSRTLKLALLAEVADFTKNIGTAGKDTETLGGQFEAFGKKAALAFAAAGAAIGAYAKVAIENAAADEKAQRNLALTIENTTTATSAQIAGVEKYISTTSIAIGVTDDELRPAFGRLVRSTKDVEEAQKLLNLALDVSAATGKPLEAVANALGKAYDGNLNALGRLGLGIDASILKSKDFDLVFNTLSDTFGGFADNEAQSTEKAFERIKIASDEVQEQIGAALLPVVQELTTFILTDVVPVVQSFVDGLTGADGLDDSLTESQTTAIEWGKRIKGLIETVITFKDELIAVGAVIASVFLVSKIAAGVAATISTINTLIKAYNALKASSIVAGVASAFALNPLLGVAAVAVGAAVLAGANALANKSDTPSAGSVGAPGFSGTMPNGQSFSTGGAVNQTKAEQAELAASIAAGQREAKIIVEGQTRGLTAEQALAEAAGKSGNKVVVDPSIAAASKKAQEAYENLNAILDKINEVVPTFNAGSFREAESRLTGPTINLTVNGAMDAEGTARTIVDTLNNSYYRGTGGATALVAI